MQSRWAIKFEEKLSEEMTRMSDHLIEGGASDYAAYREQVGFLSGLRRCNEIAREVDVLIMGG